MKLVECSVDGRKDLKIKLPLIRGEIFSFGTTTRWRFSAFQTLSFSNLLTLTFKPSEFTFTLATKNRVMRHLFHCRFKRVSRGIVLYFIWDIKVRKHITPTKNFLFLKIYHHSFVSRNRQNSRWLFLTKVTLEPWPQSNTRLLLYYTKKSLRLK